MTGPQGVTGLQGPTGTSLTWRGTYSRTFTYSLYDVVQFNGSSYIYNGTFSRGLTPSRPEFMWDLMAERGATGPGTIIEAKYVNARRGYADAFGVSASAFVPLYVGDQSGIVLGPTVSTAPHQSVPGYGALANSVYSQQIRFANLGLSWPINGGGAISHLIPDLEPNVSTSTLLSNWGVGELKGWLGQAVVTTNTQYLRGQYIATKMSFLEHIQMDLSNPRGTGVNSTTGLSYQQPFDKSLGC